MQIIIICSLQEILLGLGELMWYYFYQQNLPTEHVMCVVTTHSLLSLQTERLALTQQHTDTQQTETLTLTQLLVNVVSVCLRNDFASCSSI